VDRRALGKAVFADDALRLKLDQLMHPPILVALQEFVGYWRSVPGKAAVVEIPLLFELDLRYLVDGTLVVSCSEETQLARLIARHKLARPEAEQWIAAQWPLEKKRTLADFMVDNGGDFSETQKKLKVIWDAL
jgi:dephospho-CoA kinase